MIEIGDLVRLKSKLLSGRSILGQNRYQKGTFKRFRGKTQICRVIDVIGGEWDWKRHRWINQVIRLDKNPRRDKSPSLHAIYGADLFVVYKKRKPSLHPKPKPKPKPEPEKPFHDRFVM